MFLEIIPIQAHANAWIFCYLVDQISAAGGMQRSA